MTTIGGITRSRAIICALAVLFTFGAAAQTPSELPDPAATNSRRSWPDARLSSAAGKNHPLRQWQLVQVPSDAVDLQSLAGTHANRGCVARHGPGQRITPCHTRS